MMDSLEIEWCLDPGQAPLIAEFMTRNLDVDYISHGELMDGRALDPARWVPDLEARLGRELALALSSPSEPSAGGRIAVARGSGKLVAMAAIGFAAGSPPPFAVIEDFVVDAPERGTGNGKRLFTWIEEEMGRLGVGRLFLESGIRNRRAHAFFNRRGFKPCSLMMMKETGLDRSS